MLRTLLSLDFVGRVQFVVVLWQGPNAVDLTSFKIVTEFRTTPVMYVHYITVSRTQRKTLRSNLKEYNPMHGAIMQVSREIWQLECTVLSRVIEHVTLD